MTPAIAFIALAVTGALVVVAVIAAIALLLAGVRAIDAADAETLGEARDEERQP